MNYYEIAIIKFLLVIIIPTIIALYWNEKIQRKQQCDCPDEFKNREAWLEDNCNCNGANRDTCPYCRELNRMKHDKDTNQFAA